MLSIFCSGFFLIASAVLLACTFSIPGATEWDVVGSRLVPQIYIGGLLATSLVLFLLSLWKTVRRRSAAEKRPAPESVLSGSGKAAALCLSVLAWIGFMSWGGFYLSTFLFLFFLIWFLNGMKMCVAAPVAAAACPVIIYFLFEKGLNVLMPAGVLFG